MSLPTEQRESLRLRGCHLPQVTWSGDSEQRKCPSQGNGRERGGPRGQRVLAPNSRPVPSPSPPPTHPPPPRQRLAVGLSLCLSLLVCRMERRHPPREAVKEVNRGPAPVGATQRTQSECLNFVQGCLSRSGRRDKGGGMDSLPLPTSDWLLASQTHS